MKTLARVLFETVPLGPRLLWVVLCRDTDGTVRVVDHFRSRTLAQDSRRALTELDKRLKRSAMRRRYWVEAYERRMW